MPANHCKLAIAGKRNLELEQLEYQLRLWQYLSPWARWRILATVWIKTEPKIWWSRLKNILGRR